MKVIVTYSRGKKSLNDLIRRVDLGMEGLFIEETATITLKKSKKITEAWKNKVIECFEKAGEDCDTEFCDFKFTIEV